MLKNKRFLLVAFAILFVALIFLWQNGYLSNKNRENNSGLTYNSEETVVNLISRDTDGDGVMDWEEGLWGTDPLKKDTDGNGVEDEEEIAKLKIERGLNAENNNTSSATDKFSQELFATVATLSQAGELDEATVEKLSESLALQLSSSSADKVYTREDVKIISENSAKSFSKYNNDLNEAYKKHPTKGNAIEILDQFVGNGEEVDLSVLPKLTPVINQLSGFANTIMQINVPSELASLHLDMANGLERLASNLRDIQKFDTDIILSMGAVGQYESNVELVGSAMSGLLSLIRNKVANN